MTCLQSFGSALLYWRKVNMIWYFSKKPKSTIQRQKKTVLYLADQILWSGLHYPGHRKKFGGFGRPFFFWCSKLIQNREIRRHGPDHRVIAVASTIRDNVFLLQSIYVPVEHRQRAQFFLSLSRETEPLNIMRGDMNFTLAPDLDSATYTQQSTRDTKELQEWLDATQMVDAWRTHHPDNKKLYKLI